MTKAVFTGSTKTPVNQKNPRVIYLKISWFCCKPTVQYPQAHVLLYQEPGKIANVLCSKAVDDLSGQLIELLSGKQTQVPGEAVPGGGSAGGSRLIHTLKL